jgi:FKBP-type peptidyl-prolyl cis-trans isomerase FklB
MKVLFSLLFFSIYSLTSIGQTAQLASETDSVAYCIGLLMGTSISSAGIEDINDELFMKGINDALGKKETSVTLDQANVFMNSYVGRLNDRIAENNLAQGLAFLAENAKVQGVITLPSGLQYKIINEGSGVSPLDTSMVTVHYTGKMIDGKVFDSSVERGEPAQFPVNGVIPGWTEALKLMKPGAKWMLYIPSELAYGERGNRGILPNSVLIFEVELISVD